MSRLTIDTREKMAAALVRHRFAEQAARLVEERKALFLVAYGLHHPPAVLKHMRAILSTNRFAFSTREIIWVNVGGPTFELGTGSVASHWTVKCQALPVLVDLRNDRLSVDPESPEGKRLLAYASEEATLGKAVSAAYKEAFGTLSSFRSGKQLANDWPEALPIIGNLIPEENRSLPVIQVAKLNEAFRLPPAELEGLGR